ncbi:MAG TPA: hypothetical protein PLP05_00755 [Sedimentisphaerales bacterium]|nr:hypothetical protein [Sedimentisphaerales bacterium]
MSRKVLFIAILISLLGVISFAEPESAVDQNDVQIKAPVKQHVNRIDKWSNELKAAYEAKDMDKIGKLIEQMDEFKTKAKEAREEKGLRDGKKGGKDRKKGWRAQNGFEGDRGNRGENKSRMRRPMDEDQSEDMDRCGDNDMDQCRGGNMQGHGRMGWQENQYSDDQYPCQRSDRQFSQRHDRGRGQMRWQGEYQRQDRFNCSCCCGCCGMQKGFACRGQGMCERQDGQHWQGQGECYQSRDMWNGQGPKGQRHMRNQCQGQCSMHQQRGGFDRSDCQRESCGRGNFEDNKFNRQSSNRRSQELAPSGNEWDW